MTDRHGERGDHAPTCPVCDEEPEDFIRSNRGVLISNNGKQDATHVVPVQTADGPAIDLYFHVYDDGDDDAGETVESGYTADIRDRHSGTDPNFAESDPRGSIVRTIGNLGGSAPHQRVMLEVMPSGFSRDVVELALLDLVDDGTIVEGEDAVWSLTGT